MGDMAGCMCAKKTLPLSLAGQSRLSSSTTSLSLGLLPTQGARDDFSFCRHPFLLAPPAKAKLLRIECQAAQVEAFQRAAALSMLSGGGCAGCGGGGASPYCLLRVRRGAYFLRVRRCRGTKGAT